MLPRILLAEVEQRHDHRSFSATIYFRRNVDGDRQPRELVLRQRRVLRRIGAQRQREVLRDDLSINQGIDSSLLS